jgi:lactoylglutathione lyase
VTTWRLTEMHHVGLTVADIERSIRFYRDLLGMTLVRRRKADAEYIGMQTGCPGVCLDVASFQATSDNRQTLEVVQYVTNSGPVSEQATNRAGCAHLCLMIDDLRAAYDALRGQGVLFKTEPVAITSGPNQGGLTVYLFDPDGFTIELFQAPTDGVR